MITKMKYLDNYCPVILPTYRYVTISCKESVKNNNFDSVLKEIGTHYFHDAEAGVNGICSLIRDEINREWRLNGSKKHQSLKRVTTTQIKTIRRSFSRINSTNEQQFIRIPFDIVPILFFILTLLNGIGSGSPSVNQLFVAMNKVKIGEYLYAEHTKLFEDNYPQRMNQITDPTLQAKYAVLKANLQSPTSIMQQRYSEVNWNNIRRI